VTFLVTGVDLAARYSATCSLDFDGQVCAQDDSNSWSTETGFVHSVADHHGLIVVEDLPYRLGRFDSTMKHVARIQGRLVESCKERDRHIQHDLLFVPPHTWQQQMGVFKYKPPEVAAVARDLGYVPPNLVKEWQEEGKIPAHGKERQEARYAAKKIMTDYVDAFMIARWARACVMAAALANDSGIELTPAEYLLTVPTVERY